VVLFWLKYARGREKDFVCDQITSVVILAAMLADNIGSCVRGADIVGRRNDERHCRLTLSVMSADNVAALSKFGNTYTRGGKLIMKVSVLYLFFLCVTGSLAAERRSSTTETIGIVGSEVSMLCPHPGSAHYTPIRLAWYFIPQDHNTVTLYDGVCLYTEVSEMIMCNEKILIDAVQHKDEGQYVCAVYSSRGRGHFRHTNLYNVTYILRVYGNIVIARLHGTQ